MILLFLDPDLVEISLIIRANNVLLGKRSDVGRAYQEHVRQGVTDGCSFNLLDIVRHALERVDADAGMLLLELFDHVVHHDAVDIAKYGPVGEADATWRGRGGLGCGRALLRCTSWLRSSRLVARAILPSRGGPLDGLRWRRGIPAGEEKWTTGERG